MSDPRLPPGYAFTSDPELFDLDRCHRWIAEESSWAEGMPRPLLERAIANSLCFGVLDRRGAQVAFARLITDRATFAYLCDVFVDEAARGEGIGKALVAHILAQPHLQGLRRWMLSTRDAHALYAGFGFQALRNPDAVMELRPVESYRAP